MGVGIPTENLEKEFNIDLDAAASNDMSLAKSLRAIGATSEVNGA